MTESQPHPRALYLRGKYATTFALFHEVTGQQTETAVLICPPFGDDPMSPYRSRRDWAAHLAAGGYPALRIDLPGTGDSPGGPEDPDRLGAWTEAVSVAARWLAIASGATRIVGAGVGLGGLVAYRAASQGAWIDDIVLWAVPVRGETLVRELRAYSRLPSATAPSPGHAKPAPVPDGAVVAAGHMLSGETACSLEALDIRQMELDDLRRRRVLLVGRSGSRVDDRLRTFFEQAGADVAVTSGPGYRERGEFFQRVDRWLGGSSAPRTAKLPLRPAPVSVDSVSRHLTLGRGRSQLRETPIWIEQPEGQLFGIVAEPRDVRGDVSLILMGGARRHTGPSRLWVEIAREWAARGVPSLRFDMAGIGDSEGPTDAEAPGFCELMPLSDPQYLEATSAALDMLASRGLPGRVVAVGLCSGAYWALHSALRERRIAGVLLFNPPALTWDDEVAAAYQRVQRRWTASSIRRRLIVRETWRKLFTGEISPARCLSLAWDVGSGRALDAWRETRLPDHTSDAELAGGQVVDLLDALRDRDQTGVLMLTGDEPLRAELTATGLLDRLDRWPNLNVVLAGEADGAHSLTPLWAQQQVMDLVGRAVARELDHSSVAPDRGTASQRLYPAEARTIG